VCSRGCSGGAADPVQESQGESQGHPEATASGAHIEQPRQRLGGEGRCVPPSESELASSNTDGAARSACPQPKGVNGVDVLSGNNINA
jgi:hypothetical protein